jgi:hypothetical protein
VPVASPSAAAAPHRRQPPSTLRRISLVVLVVGTVVSVAAAFGPLWAVRCGVVVAVTAAVLATALAWRQLFVQRRRHAAQTLAASRAHHQALREERQHNAAVLRVVTDRNDQAMIELERQQRVIGGLRTEVARLRGDKAGLSATLARRETELAEVRVILQARDAELQELTSPDGVNAEVRAMPRRLLVELGSGDQGGPAADELWSDGDHPTVVDLAAIEVPAMPNFEVDRRLA